MSFYQIGILKKCLKGVGGQCGDRCSTFFKIFTHSLTHKHYTYLHNIFVNFIEETAQRTGENAVSFIFSNLKFVH